jgi:hypothetical protein
MSKTISLKLEDDLFLDIKKISEIFNISCSEFVRNAIKREIDTKKSDFMVRMSNVSILLNQRNVETSFFIKN